MSEKIKVWIGSEVHGQSGQYQSDKRPVTFEGEKLAELTTYGNGRNGGITDTRGATQTLYQAADGRLIVHVDAWSKWQGEPSTERLHQVTEDDLGPNGRFESLGREAGYGRDLSLDEALSPGRECDELDEWEPDER